MRINLKKLFVFAYLILNHILRCNECRGHTNNVDNIYICNVRKRAEQIR